MLVSMVFQTLYVLVDLFWVGRLGTEAVAAVAVAGNLTFVVMALSQMLGVGATTLVSHASGRQDRERALFVFNQSQVLSMAAGVVFLVAAMAARLPYARALSADEATASLAAEYLLWFIPAMALQFAIVAMGAALRGTGNFKPGTIVQTGTVALNMALAPVLIFGWGTGRPLGVAGAALSTLVSIAVGVLWIAWFFLDRHAYLRFRPADWRPRLPLWGDMLKVGLPAGLEFLLMGVTLATMYTLTRRFGAAAQAGFGVGFRILQSAFLPVVALGFAVAPVAGQNFGARQWARVREAFRMAALLASAFMAVSAVGLYAFAPSVVRVFTADAQVLATGVEYLRIVVFSFVFSGLTFVSASMFQAMGHTLPSLVTSSIRVAALVVPAIVVSRREGFELRWLWYLMVLSVTLQAAMNLALLRREFRVRMS